MIIVVTNQSQPITVAVQRVGDGSIVVVASQQPTVTVAIARTGIPGPQGPAGTGLETVTPVLVGLQWGTPAAESGNSIEIPATIKDFAGVDLASSIVDVEITVTDSAADSEPSATATLSAANTPVGTVLCGTGTARLDIRSASGALRIKVTETAAGNRYLWVKAGGITRLWVRSLTGVQELVFA